MKKILNILKRLSPYLVLFLIELVLFYRNYVPGTFLMGWDNLMPEFNFALNFKRTFFAVWQEYRGLGLYDGMSHTANLIYILFLWSASFILPLNLLRYFFHFLMHFLGGVGMYLLLYNVILGSLRQSASEASLTRNPSNLDSRWNLPHALTRGGNDTKKITHNIKLISLLGAIFYQFNLITIQMFYTPLEAFSVHFAALPFIALTLINYLRNGNRKNLLLFLAVLILSTPQYFVATLFFPVFVLIASIVFSFYFFKQTSLRCVLITVTSFFLINSFWLLPYLYGALSNAKVIVSAKINQMSSEEIFLRNKAFGDLPNVLLMRGFSLDFMDLNPQGKSSLMMEDWRNHIYGLQATIIAGLVVVISLFGLLIAGKKVRQSLKIRQLKLTKFSEVILAPFILIFLFGFLMLGINIPLVKEITNLMRTYVPFFGEAFRFPFTKFSLIYGFSYTIFFAFGIFLLGIILPKHWERILVILALIIMTLYLAFPAFKGKFTYAQLRVNLPNEYLQLFSYLKNKDKDDRIVQLPAFEYWSWKYYRWGYRGSGFLWYGIPQPLLDRAFDPWSNSNENFYWELSHAIYSKDEKQLVDVLTKYHVTYILHDKNIISANHNRPLFTEEISELLSETEFTEEKTFNNLVLYKLNSVNSSSNLVIYSDLPKIYPGYKIANDDRAYEILANYISATKPADADVIFPFRSLATQRSIDEREFQVYEDNDNFILRSLVKDNYGVPIQSGIFPKDENLVFDSDIADVFQKTQPTVCDGQDKTADTQTFYSDNKKWLRMQGKNLRTCFSFGIGDLSHHDGYLVTVESRNISGKPYRIGLINKTAKHVEIEADLPKDKEWKTSYFILPPLAADGLGYDLYLTNYSFASDESVNDLSKIRVYRFLYEELLNFNLVQKEPENNSIPSEVYLKTQQIFPMLYQINLKQIAGDSYLTFFESFDHGWLAFVKTDKFPYFTRLDNHILVNNWANGWSLGEKLTINNPSTSLRTSQQQTIYLFFWPQTLVWIGFGLLILPLIMLFKKDTIPL